MTSKLVWYVVYTCLFSVSIFLWVSILWDFHGNDQVNPEDHIEFHQNDFSHIHEEDAVIGDAKIKEILYASRQEKYEQDLRSRLTHSYIPSTYEGRFPEGHMSVLRSFFSSLEILRSIDMLRIFHHESEWTSRGRMKWWHIHLYGAKGMKNDEYLWVAIHEYAHHYDIHTMTSWILWDKSDDFYKISWNNIYDIKPWQDYDSFVSWYAMTNMYEDFAESFTLFMIRNDIFLSRAETSPILMEKYNYFLDKNIYDPLFSSAPEWVQTYDEYIWDTTKVSYDTQKFLQYFHDDV